VSLYELYFASFYRLSLAYLEENYILKAEINHSEEKIIIFYSLKEKTKLRIFMAQKWGFGSVLQDWGLTKYIFDIK